MRKSKMLALTVAFAASTTFSAVSSANAVDVNDQAIWSTATAGMTSDLTNDLASIVANRSTSSGSSFPVPPAFWLLGTAMVFLFRKPHSS